MALSRLVSISTIAAILLLAKPVTAQTPAYHAVLVSCAGPAQCIVMLAGEFTAAADCLARLELARELRVMELEGTPRSWDRAFCALDKRGKQTAEELDFIRRHQEELAPHIEQIERSEKGAVPD